MGGGGGGVSDNSSYMNGMGLARLVSVLCWWSDVGVEEAGLMSDVVVLVEIHVARVLRRL